MILTIVPRLKFQTLTHSHDQEIAVRNVATTLVDDEGYIITFSYKNTAFKVQSMALLYINNANDKKLRSKSQTQPRATNPPFYSFLIVSPIDMN